jgi:ligand-binding sensor domain-containing protein
MGKKFPEILIDVMSLITYTLPHWRSVTLAGASVERPAKEMAGAGAFVKVSLKSASAEWKLAKMQLNNQKKPSPGFFCFLNYGSGDFVRTMIS